MSLNPTKFDDHKHFGRGDLIILVCCMILKDHVIKRLCYFMSRSPLRQVTILQSLVAITTLIVKS